jgi:hypothetical protein
MRRIHLLSTVLGTMLLATPALAQRDAMSEMRPGDSSATPWVPRQDRNAAMADGVSGGPEALLRQAQEALRRNRPGEATELLERAETRVLSRSTMANGEEPMRGGLVQHTAAARAALMRRDREGAMREIDMAMNDRMGAAGGSMTGGDSGMRPMQGGMAQPGMHQPGMGHGMGGPADGSATWRDQGPAGRSMSRADIILAQSGSGAGGLSGSTPGSPGLGAPGSTPQSTMGSPQQPAQGSAVPNMPAQGGQQGVGAPAPGATRPMTGGTGTAPGDTTPRR